MPGGDHLSRNNGAGSVMSPTRSSGPFDMTAFNTPGDARTCRTIVTRETPGGSDPAAGVASLPPAVGRLHPVGGRRRDDLVRAHPAGVGPHPVDGGGRAGRTGDAAAAAGGRPVRRGADRRGRHPAAGARLHRRPGGDLGPADRAGVARPGPGRPALRARRRAVGVRRRERAGPPVAHPGAAARPTAGARAGAAADLLPGHDDLRPGPGRGGGRRAASGLARLLPHRHGLVRLRAVRRRYPAESSQQRKFNIRSSRTDPAFLCLGRFLVHRADPGAGGGVPDRCLRDVLRAADVAVPGAQRGAVRRRPAHARAVHRRGRGGRHGHRGAVWTAQARDPAGRGDAGGGGDLGRRVRRLRDRALALAHAAGARRRGRGRHDHGRRPGDDRVDRDPGGVPRPGDGGRLRGRGRRPAARLGRGRRGRGADHPGHQRPVRRPAGDRGHRRHRPRAPGLPPLPAGCARRPGAGRPGPGVVKARSSGRR
jgi:hypothetical protein